MPPLFVDGVEIDSVFVDGVEQDNMFVDGVEVFSGASNHIVTQGHWPGLFEFFGYATAAAGTINQAFGAIDNQFFEGQSIEEIAFLNFQGDTSFSIIFLNAQPQNLWEAADVQYAGIFLSANANFTSGALSSSWNFPNTPIPPEWNGVGNALIKLS